MDDHSDDQTGLEKTEPTEDGRQVRLRLNCPHCQNPIAVLADSAEDDVVCPSCGSTFRVDRQQTVSWRPEKLPQLGKFELLEAVGRGAFGTVYRARDSELDRIVAVKVPRSGTFATQEDEDRFIREARSVAQLHHAGIIPVFEVGHAESYPYVVTQYVQGITLADALTGRRFGFRESAEILVQVAEALEHSHQQRVVHRDLKPSNIMLQEEEGRMRALLMDFGLARREEGEATVTADGQVLGTPAYMSPEQARGEGHRVDGRSDIYSAGVVLYELLAGELPFRGNLRMILHQVLNTDPQAPRKLNDRVPRELETICLKCMDKEPARRYATAADLAAELRRYLAGEPILARPISRPFRLWRWCQRNPGTAALTSAVVFLLLSVAIVASAGYVATSRALENSRMSLHDSLCQQAHSLWLAREPGWREKSLSAIRQAAEIRPDARLKSLAVQSLVSWDWQVDHTIPTAQDAASLAISPDGKGLAVAVESTLKVYDLKTGDCIGTLESPNGAAFSCFQFNSSGVLIVCGDKDGWIHVWDWRGKTRVLSQKVHDSAVGSVTFGPGRDRIASTDGMVVRVWDQGTGRKCFEDGLKPAPPRPAPAPAPAPSPAPAPPPVPAPQKGASNRGRSYPLDTVVAGRAILLAGMLFQPVPAAPLVQPPPVEFAPELSAPSAAMFGDATNAAFSRIGGPVGATLATELRGPLYTALAASEDEPLLAAATSVWPPVLWIAHGERWERRALDGYLPSGYAIRLALSRGNRYLILACNEPRRNGIAFFDPQPPFAAPPPPAPAPAKRPEPPQPPPPARPSSSTPSPTPANQTSRPDKPQPPVAVTRKAPAQSVDAKSEERSDRSGRRVQPVLSGPSRIGYVFFYDIQQGNMIKGLGPGGYDKVQIGAVAGVVAARNSDVVLLAGSSGTTVLYRLTPTEVGRMGIWKAPVRRILAADIAPDGQGCAVAAAGEPIKVSRLAGIHHSSYLRVGASDYGQVAPWFTMAASEQQECLALARWGEAVELCRAATGEKIASIPRRNVWTFAWSKRGDRLAVVADEPGGIEVFPVAAPSAGQTAPMDVKSPQKIPADFPVFALAFSQDDAWLAFGGKDSGIRLWRTGKEGYAAQRILEPTRGQSIFDLAFNPAGTHLAGAYQDRTLRIWRTADWQLAKELRFPAGNIHAVAFVPNRARLAVALSSGDLVLLDTEDWSEKRRWTTTREILSVSCRSDGRFLAAAHRDGHVSLWDLADESLVADWLAHESGTNAVAFSADGNRIISCGLDVEVRAWHLDAVETSLRELGLPLNHD